VWPRKAIAGRDLWPELFICIRNGLAPFTSRVGSLRHRSHGIAPSGSFTTREAALPKGRFLAEFELYVMLGVAGLGEGAYGAAIRRAIRGRTGRPVSIGAVYATVSRLEEKGLLSHAVSEPRPVPGGRARKIYALTPAGEAAVAHSTNMIRRMVEGVELDGLEAWAP